jgi:hypothetical protein
MITKLYTDLLAKDQSHLAFPAHIAIPDFDERVVLLAFAECRRVHAL